VSPETVGPAVVLELAFRVSGTGRRGPQLQNLAIDQDTAMPKLDERIRTLETKLEQLKVRQARIDARKRALLSRRARKDDTRRKILAGAIVLAKVDQGELDPKQFRAWLEAALTRADDRALFGL
jgi:hypothetical protein